MGEIIEIVIYGSYAKRARVADHYNDIDVMVFGDPQVPSDESVMKYIRNVTGDFTSPIQLFRLCNPSRLTRDQVIHEGVVVYRGINTKFGFLGYAESTRGISNTHGKNVRVRRGLDS